MKTLGIIAICLSILQANPLTACGGGGTRTWTGSVSSDWLDSDNWLGSCGNPTPTSTVNIDGSYANPPFLASLSDIRALDFSNAPTFTIGTNGFLNVETSIFCSDNTLANVLIQDGGKLSANSSLCSAGSIAYELSNGSHLTGSGQEDGALLIIKTLEGGAGNTVTLAGGSAIHEIQSLNKEDQFVFEGDVRVINGMNLAGNLNLNHAIIGNLTLNGGRLSGVGSVFGNLSVLSGTIAPGNSIGTMTVNGNYFQGPGSNYFVQLDSNGNSTLLDVSGAATIDPGAIVTATSLDGEVSNGRYTILTADGGVSGAYGAVVGLGLPRTPRLSYDENNVYLLFQSFLDAARTHNERAVAVQLDSLTDPTPSQQALLAQLNSLDESSQAKAMSQMSGSQYLTYLSAYEVAARQLHQRLGNVLRPIYTDPCYYGGEGCSMFKPWIEINGNHVKLQRTNNSAQARWNGFSVTGGLQGQFSDLTVGSALSYENDKIRFNSHEGSGRNHLYLGSIYSVYRKSNCYLWGNFLAGYGTGKMSRDVSLGEAEYRPRGKPREFLTDVYLEMGMDYSFCGVLLQPFVGIDAGYYVFDKFSEKKGDPIDLKIHHRSYGVLSSALGAHFTLNPDFCGCKIGLDAAWRYRLTKIEKSLGANFKEFGGGFTVLGNYLGKNSFETTVSLVKDISCSAFTFLDLTGQWWTHAASYSISGGVQWNW